MAGRKAKAKAKAPDRLDGGVLLARVLERTRAAIEESRAQREGENERRRASGRALLRPINDNLSFAIYFAKYMGEELAAGLEPHFPGIRSGETPSMSIRGPKRVDLSYGTPDAGLGLAVSFKSVHLGERDGGNAAFTHNMKRNDEELRVEAMAHHLRQPYAVMAAVLFLPFESCHDDATSSFASWVEYLWPLHGRDEPEDPSDRFELVFVGLYARDGSELGFYEVGGDVPCPRRGRPGRLLTPAALVNRLRVTYDQRNSRDFFFEGEAPKE